MHGLKNATQTCGQFHNTQQDMIERPGTNFSPFWVIDNDE